MLGVQLLSVVLVIPHRYYVLYSYLPPRCTCSSLTSNELFVVNSNALASQNITTTVNQANDSSQKLAHFAPRFVLVGVGCLEVWERLDYACVTMQSCARRGPAGSQFRTLYVSATYYDVNCKGFGKLGRALPTHA